jgi:hypothetical protein
MFGDRVCLTSTAWVAGEHGGGVDSISALSLLLASFGFPIFEESTLDKRNLSEALKHWKA